MTVFTKILNQQTAIDRAKRVLAKIEVINNHWVFGSTFSLKVYETDGGFYFTCYYMGNSDKQVKTYTGDVISETIKLALLDGISYCLTHFFGFVLSSKGLGSKLSAIRNELLKKRSELYAKQQTLF